MHACVAMKAGLFTLGNVQWLDSLNNSLLTKETHKYGKELHKCQANRRLRNHQAIAKAIMRTSLKPCLNTRCELENWTSKPAYTHVQQSSTFLDKFHRGSVTTSNAWELPDLLGASSGVWAKISGFHFHDACCRNRLSAKMPTCATTVVDYTCVPPVKQNMAALTDTQENLSATQDLMHRMG